MSATPSPTAPSLVGMIEGVHKGGNWGRLRCKVSVVKDERVQIEKAVEERVDGMYKSARGNRYTS